MLIVLNMRDLEMHENFISRGPVSALPLFA